MRIRESAKTTEHDDAATRAEFAGDQRGSQQQARHAGRDHLDSIQDTELGQGERADALRARIDVRSHRCSAITRTAAAIARSTASRLTA